MARNRARLGVAALLVAVIAGGVVTVIRTAETTHRTNITAYFANTTGLFPGDEVRLLGVRVGKIDRIEPQPQRVKVSFWVNNKYPIPADAKAVILSPTLVTSRAIQLTPAYTKGPKMADHAVIPQDRTAVPVEYDQFRQQLEKLTTALQPTTPGGVSTLGAFINTAADNLRGQGANIRDTLIKMSQAFSALGDHSDDLFTTVRNLSLVVTALRDSSDVLRGLNQNLASVTSVLAHGDNAVGRAVAAINDVAGDVQRFANDNRETLGDSADKLAALGTTLNQSIDEIEQALHIAPTLFSNFLNIMQPAQQAITGVVVLTNFASTIQFLCGAIQAASRLGAEQSAKLCVQYLAPIIKNRQYNFPMFGENAFVGAQARPNEITYSEDWLRPDYVPPPGPNPTPPADSAPTPAPPARPPAPTPDAALPAEAQSTNPANGLSGLMVPPGAGS